MAYWEQETQPRKRIRLDDILNSDSSITDPSVSFNPPRHQHDAIQEELSDVRLQSQSALQQSTITVSDGQSRTTDRLEHDDIVDVDYSAVQTVQCFQSLKGSSPLREVSSRHFKDQVCFGMVCKKYLMWISSRWNIAY